MYIQIAYPNGKTATHQVPETESWALQIGSGRSSQVLLKGKGIQPLHATLVGRSGKVFLEPAEGATALLDHRELRTPTRIRMSHEIDIGGVKLRLRDPILEDSSSALDSHSSPAQAFSDVTVVRRDRDQKPSAAQSGPSRILLDGGELTIGRTVEGVGKVDDPQVSREHAVLRNAAGRWSIRDAGSTNGTFVNGESITRWRELNQGDVVALGSLLFEFDGHALCRSGDRDGIRVDVVGLTKTVRHRDTGEPLNLIDGIDMCVEPGEFVVMLGSSGCGKSTFMDAINGRRRATRGKVCFNGRDLYSEFPSLKRAIGYVPQEVIYHKALSVGDILLHAAHLRLPTDTSASEIEERIKAVLERVGLQERRRTPAAALSGGQQKRVSIAIELLSQPKILFLDEVTSGLDMKTEREMMELFRQLADDGITIFCITHHLESLDTCHHIAYFYKGKLAFFGPEPDFLNHFEIEHTSQVYGCEAGADPIEWERRYTLSRLGQRLLTDRMEKARSSMSQGSKESSAAKVAAEHSRLSAERAGVQTATLTRRYVKLLLADRATLAVTLSLAPVIGAVMAFAAASWPETMGFQAMNVAVMAIATVFFFGLFTSSREIVRDLPVYLHERMIGLEIVPYLLSRIVPLAVIGLFQVLVFIGILRMFTQFEHIGTWATVVPVLYATTLAGSMLGLLISAMVERVDTAVSLMIFAVVPQLLFAGNLGELEQPQKGVASTLVSSYWAYDACEALLELPSTGGDIGSVSEGGAPPSEVTESTEESDTVGVGDWLPQVGIVLAQAAVFLFGAFLFVLRRDGAGAIRRCFAGAGRVVQARNKDDLLVFTGWVSGASKGLRS